MNNRCQRFSKLTIKDLYSNIIGKENLESEWFFNYLAGFSDNIATALPMETPKMFTRERNVSSRVQQLPAKVFVPIIDMVRPLGDTCTRRTYEND